MQKIEIKGFPNAATITGSICLILLIFIIYSMLSSIYLTMLLGIVVGIALKPNHKRLTVQFGGHKRSAAIAIIIMTMILVFAPIILLLQQAASEAVHFSKNTNNFTVFENSVDNLTEAINKQTSRFNNFKITIQKEEVVQFIKDKAAVIGESILSVVTDLFAILANSIILFLTIYYTLVDWEKAKDYIYSYSLLNKKATRKLTDRAITVIRTSVKGNILLIFIHLIIGLIGFSVFGIKPLLLLSALYALTAVIPAISSGVVWMPVALYLALSGNYFAAIAFVVYNVALIGTLDNFIYPLLVQKGTRLHPFFVLVGILGGLSFFGLVGFIIGPTIIALTFVFIELLKESQNQVSKKLLTKTT